MAVKTIVKFRLRGKCRRFAAKWFTFPGKNSKIAVESTFPAGKCLEFVENWFTFPGENGENDSKINISGGKVHLIPGKLVHFPGVLNR